MSAVLVTHRMNWSDLQKVLWSEFVTKHKGGFKPRRPAESLEGLVPLTARGYCFGSVLQDGDRFWFDPEMRAEDGDVVWCELHPEVVARAYAAQANDPRFVQTYGTTPRTQAMKVLRRFRGSDYLVCADGIIRLDGDYGPGVPREPSKILGVLRSVGNEINLLPGVQPPRHTADLNPNAATDTYSATDAGPITVTLAGAATDAVYQIKYVEVTLDESSTVEVSASYRVAVTSPGGAGWTVTHGVARMNTAGTSVNFAQPINKNGVNAYEPIGSAGQFTQAAGTYRFGVGCRIQDVTAADVDAIFRDISIAVNVVKR